MDQHTSAPLLCMIERISDAPGNPGEPVITLLRPMPRWLAWLCRCWQRQAPAYKTSTVFSKARLTAERYAVATTRAVFSQLTWDDPDPAPPDAATPVHLVLTPSQDMLRAAGSQQATEDNEV